MKTLALFDFDRTLYKKDSLIEFTRFASGNAALYKGLLALFPNLIGMKLRLLQNQAVKEKYMRFFFGAMNETEFRSTATDFALKQIQIDLDPRIFAEFLEQIQSGSEVYIVTASFPEWIHPWSDQYGVKVIGTKIAFENGKLSAVFGSKNCYGAEKVNRVSEIVNLNDFENIQVYGSGKGDFEMLKLSR